MTRIALGLLVALGALAVAAIGAVSASAHEFVATASEFPAQLRGESTGEQEFNFNKIRVVCQRANIKGTLDSPTSETLPLAVTYKECTTGPIEVFGKKTEVPMRLKEKAEYTFHVNGWVESGEEIEMRAKFVKCLVNWFSGTYPPSAEEHPEKEFSAATYSNKEVSVPISKRFPLGKQKKVAITNFFKNLEWSEEGGGVCEDEDIELLEGEHGKYVGQMLVGVSGGNLEFQ